MDGATNANRGDVLPWMQNFGRTAGGHERKEMGEDQARQQAGDERTFIQADAWKKGKGCELIVRRRGMCREERCMPGDRFVKGSGMDWT